MDLQHTANQWQSVGSNLKIGTCGEVAESRARFPPGSGNEWFRFYTPSVAEGRDVPLLGPATNAYDLVFGYDSETGNVVAHTERALMSYCSATSWFDLDSYNYVFDGQRAVGAVAVEERAANADSYFLVSGTVDVETLVAEFRPLELVVPAVDPVEAAAGEWELVAHYSNQPDVAFPLHLSVSPDYPRQAEFSAFVAYDPLISGFTLRRSAAPILGLSSSANVPSIEIIAPVPGSVFDGRDITLAWNASDPDGDQLTFMVAYSPDDGSTWVTLSSHLSGTQLVVSSDLIEPSQRALFRVTALDGFHSTSDTLDGPIVVEASVRIFMDGFE
jgi:hypothetical protein